MKTKKYTEDKLLSLKHKSSSLNYGVDLMHKYPDKFDWEKIHSKIQKMKKSDKEKIIYDILNKNK